MTFNWAYAYSILPDLLKALVITIQATIIGMGIATVLGLLLALGRRSKNRILSTLTGALVEFVRTTPLLVQLYFLFYVLPNFGINLSPLLTGFLGLGLHYSAYTSEVYRAGIDAVSKEQWEASIALNFSPLRTWTSIILPQAIPPMVPALGNYLIAMFKDTPQLSAITVVEILTTAKIEASHTFRYLEPFTMVGGLFMLLSYPSSMLVRKLEVYLGQKYRVI